MDFTLFFANIFIFFGGYYLGLYSGVSNSLKIDELLGSIVTQMRMKNEYERKGLENKIIKNHQRNKKNKEKYLGRSIFFLTLAVFYFVMRLIVFYIAGF